MTHRNPKVRRHPWSATLLAVGAVLSCLWSGFGGGPADAARQAAGQPSFTIKNLGLLPNAKYSQADGIDNNGDITGQSGISFGATQATLFGPGGAVTGLGTGIAGHSSYGNSINDSGEVVASVLVSGSPYVQRAEAVEKTAMGYDWTALTGPNGKAINGEPSAINDSGDIVGWGYAKDKAFAGMWKGPSHTFSSPSLPTGTTRSYLSGIDAQGDVTGEAATSAAGKKDRGYVWIGGARRNLRSGEMADESRGQAVVRLAGTDTVAVAGSVWNSNKSLGAVWTIPVNHPAAASPNILQGFKHMPDVDVNGINNKGWVVGDAYNEGTDAQAAVLWVDGQPLNLNHLVPAGSGWRLTTAMAINDGGEIVGSGTYDKRTTAFELTPK